MIQFTLTLKMAATQVVEMSVTVNNNSLIQEYVHVHPDDHTQPTYDSWLGTFHSIYFVHKVMKSYFVKYSVA